MKKHWKFWVTALVLTIIVSVTYTIGITNNPNFEIHDFFMGLSTEIVGVVIALAVIDRYAQLRIERREDIRKKKEKLVADGIQLWEVKLLIKEKHDGCGIFPMFQKYTAVSELSPCNENPHWFSCVIEGYETFVPDVYVADNILIKDYNPTELIAKKEQVVTLEKIVYEWVYVRDSNGKEGWLPASKVISI